MTVSKIPDYMPILSAGKHDSPSGGACVMEFVSWLAGEKWTDEPECVHVEVARRARLINDAVRSESRQRLLPLLPKIMATGQGDRERNLTLKQNALAAVTYNIYYGYSPGPWPSLTELQSMEDCLIEAFELFVDSMLPDDAPVVEVTERQAVEFQTLLGAAA